MATTLASVEEALDRLATFASESDPVVSLYLDLRPDQHGRRHYEKFVERNFQEQIDTFEPSSPARRRLQEDYKRISTYLATQIRISAQTLAVFSCSGQPELFEHLQLDMPTDGHRLYIDRRPHLFPLARLTDEYAKYAVLLVDTNSARLHVFAIGAMQRTLVLKSEKPTRTPGVDVFSEGEYQRSSENLHLRHMKEVAAAVERVAREEGVRQIFVAAGPVALPLVREVLSGETQQKLVEISNLDIHTPDAGVLQATLQAFRETNAEAHQMDVEHVLGAFRARALGTIGLARVRAALMLGQVDRLLVPAVPNAAAADEASPDVGGSVQKTQRSRLSETVIEELVLRARQTDADVTFIEDTALLVPAAGVAAFLRFRLSKPEARRE